MQTQLQQRQDVFEEQIIKRVREIQKYSKGLNILIRKNVMADISKLKENINEAPTGKGPQKAESSNDDILNIISNLKEQLANQGQEVLAMAEKVEDNDELVENMQINMDSEIKTKYKMLDERLLKLQ